MELSCTEVPLYGQKTVLAKFEEAVYLPEDAEFYFVYRGSSQRHVVHAQRLNDNTLQSTLPGHDSLETVSVSVCMYTKRYSPVIVGGGSVTYIQDMACKLSNFLVGQVDYITSASHQTMCDQFGLSDEDLHLLDHDVMMAMAHLSLPTTWNVLGKYSEGETACKESLLHLTARLGLSQLSHFLLSQPGGTEAVTVTNEEGATPVHLAAQNGHTELVEILTNSQDTPSPAFRRAVINERAVLHFRRDLGVLALSFNHTPENSLESDIQLLRRCLGDAAFLSKILNSQQVQQERLQMYYNSTSTEEDTVSLISSESSPETEDVKLSKGPVGHSSENEGLMQLDPEKRHSFDVFKKSKNPSTFFAASRLTAMLNGRDEVYANHMVVDKVGDLDINYINLDCVTTDTSSTDPADSTPSSESCAFPSPKEGNQVTHTDADHSRISASQEDQQPFFSSLKLPASAAPHLPLRPCGFRIHRDPSYGSIKKRSSSLDGLDADSEGEGNSNQPRISYPLTNLNSSGPLTASEDELNSFERTTGLDANLAGCDSFSLSSSLQSKDFSPFGVRLRSYSYSSPKPFSGKSRIFRDNTASDSSEDGVFINSGRSLLHALSLSKSVSLLHPCKQRAYSLPDPSEGERIEEEEWDKYITPIKSESEKYKVSRTFSFLKSRMSSTRNKNKTKNKDSKEKEKLSRHQFAVGTFAGVAPCLVCEKALLGKEALQCANCNGNVHKNCKDSAPPCMKKVKERSHTKNRQSAVLTNSSHRDIPQPVFSSMHPSSSLPVGLSALRKETSQQMYPLSKSVPTASFERSLQTLETEVDSGPWRSRSHSEELLQSVGISSSVDSFAIEDVDTPLWSDLRADALEFEADSWSLNVDPAFCNKQEKDVVKRQDVIFELMQTELHHIQTLFIMSEIFRRGMKEELQLDHSIVDKIFPCLDELLEIHRQFFSRMKERRQESVEGTDRNVVINRIGDILVQQFSGENAHKMKQIYGEFCSHHKEAVNLFKELQQNKKFQNFIKLRNSNLLTRRREIPECILLVTQRITKYPVLVERILQYSKEWTEEHKDLCKALSLIKDMIAAVDLRVSEFEKEQKLLEILNKIENKTYTKLKNGHAFKKQDLLSKERILLHEGLVYWKTATGRFKDILALLLTDVLLFLQEKDQRYTFAAVDQKPPVISLQKLIVREVANEERGMFLISASSAGPEMYEIHTSSKEERNNWMRQIQEAVQSCPEEEEGKMYESDEDKRITEARVAKIKKIEECLHNQDQQLCNYLEEKLLIQAKLARMNCRKDVHLESHLLIKPDTGEIPQVAPLLTAALREVAELRSMYSKYEAKLSADFQGHGKNVSCSSHSLALEEGLEVGSLPMAEASQMDNTEGRSLEDSSEKSSLTLESFDEIPESSADSLITEEKENGEEICDFDPSLDHILNEVQESYLGDKIIQALHSLTRLLYSIQAAVIIQDTHIAVHEALLQDHDKTSKGHCSHANLLLEQEKYHSLKKHREDLANLHKLQHQFQQDLQRWHRECEQREWEQDEKEALLLERERECQNQEELLQRNREELDIQLQEHQQNMERLRKGQRLVEKDMEKYQVQQKLLRYWKHNRQSSLPTSFSLSKNEVIGQSQSNSSLDEDSVYINEALVHMSFNNCNRSNSPLAHLDHVNENIHSSSDITRTTEIQSSHQMDASSYSTAINKPLNCIRLCHEISENPPPFCKGDCTEDKNYKNDLLSDDLIVKPEDYSDQLLKNTAPKHQDLSASQVIYCDALLAPVTGRHSPNSGDFQLQHSSEGLVNPQSNTLQNAENGDIEENIIYL
ncbi:rho guanine nucleotide exchange factor 28 isoform X2 [Rhinatrema bivittatum]|uniref:rho guanine nucleotide exchange factor 28 isoform X2 n=1 Tax=Rhinatrema bivittatum TaxID=194408 RepID=UPI00112AD870|nr:rho guanine nucleotide exchange factor 28 isoform X2 [Rhinatrema bivittatum]